MNKILASLFLFHSLFFASGTAYSSNLKNLAFTELKSTYAQQFQSLKGQLENQKRLSGLERYQYAFSPVSLDLGQRIARLLVLADEQESIAKSYYEGLSEKELYDPPENNAQIISMALYVLKAKLKMLCNGCHSLQQWQEHRKTVEAYFEAFDIHDAHQGFSGLPFTKLMQQRFFQKQFQTDVVRLFKRLELVLHSLVVERKPLQTNLLQEALNATEGDNNRAIELLGLLTSRDVLLTRYLKYLRTKNSDFMHAFAMTPVFLRLIVEVDRRGLQSNKDRFSYDGSFEADDNRNYYFWSSALASQILLKAGYQESYVKQMAAEFPRQYKLLRYLESFGFVKSDDWKIEFFKNAQKALELANRGHALTSEKLSFEPSEKDLQEESDEIQIFLKSLRAYRNVENSYVIDWLSKVLATGLPEGRAAVLYYDFANSRIGLSHLKLMIGNRVFEIHRFKNSNGHYLRETSPLVSFQDAKPGSIPTGILEFPLSQNQMESVIEVLRLSSGGSMKYSFFNKFLDQKAYNCAGIIYDSLKSAGLPLKNMTSIDILPQQIFQKLADTLPQARLLGKNGKWQNNIVIPNISRTTFFPSQARPNVDFKDSVGAETLKAEQNLQSTTPFFSNMRNVLGLIFPRFRTNGKLDPKYWPKNAKSFEVPTVLLSQEQVQLFFISQYISPEIQNVLMPIVDGIHYYRFFIHPSEVHNYESLFLEGKKDPYKWLGTPTSSGRTLYVKKVDGSSSTFVVKTSLSEKIGGASRIINRERARRAVVVSDTLTQLHLETKGGLPDGKFWTFYKETASIIPKNLFPGGQILRELDSKENEMESLSLYSLISKRPQKETWIEEFYRYSGYHSKVDFIWWDYVKPLLDLHILLSLENGISTELHQQNARVIFDLAKRRIIGIGIKDMDSHCIDQSLRRNYLKVSTPQLEVNLDNAYDLRFKLAQSNQFKSYAEILRTRSFEWILKYFLSSSELKSVLKLADDYYLKAFNKQFPAYSVSAVPELPQAWERLHNDVTTPEEKAVYLKMDELDPHKYRGHLTEGIERLQTWTTNRKLSATSQFSSQCRLLTEPRK